jgi:four helix bundle protein
VKTHFDHEKLAVYQKALVFARWSEAILERSEKAGAIQGQFDRARTSIPLNIPEGNGRFKAADRCGFFDIANQSNKQ